MKTPRDVYGSAFARHLIKYWDYREIHQTGSHIVLRTDSPFGHTVSIPSHKPLKTGTFSDILSDIARHKQVEKSDILQRL